MKNIPLARIYLDDEMRAAAHAAIESGRYILADECAAFEEELARYIGMKHCVLSSSWTAAVYLLHMAMDVKAGDEIIVPSHTAFPTIEPLIHLGARPVFVDVDDTYCVDPAAAEAAITPRTVGMIPVHLYGHPANLDRLLAIARSRGLWLLEDCAQSFGANYNGKRAGSFGTASAFSFYPTKNLTVLGDGGCIMTNDAVVAQRVRMLRDHGRKSKYTHELVGFNLRFNEIQAAVGRVMLRRIDALNAHRRKVAARYNERLAGIAQTPPERDFGEAVYHLYVIRHAQREALAKHLADHGVATGVHYPIPNHQQPAITARFSDLPRLPRTEALVNEILSLPVYGDLALEDVDFVCEQIAAFRG
jgi:dTDP-4-amino-4,6-dideoxygalactose transaminase